ncbi:VOC family protein [Psychroserpens sp.]|uniref:VOC family protein n=1 Tax=Psychroserpens sp. TaxID=2020870 RepID=UPI002B26F103|nr:VOC family protein [Psychroserpens sp.]
MQISRTGHILYVNNYEECIEFYGQSLKLPVLFKNEDLTCFDFYGTYLMVEKEDRQDYLNDHSEIRTYSCIRLNVDDVKQHSDKLKSQNIAVDYQEHKWGIVAKFKDPDGNLIAFKDEESFAKQIEDYKS